MFGLQGPEAQTKQNPGLEGPHDSQGQRSRQMKPQHPRTTRKRVGWVHLMVTQKQVPAFFFLFITWHFCLHTIHYKHVPTPYTFSNEHSNHRIHHITMAPIPPADGEGESLSYHTPVWGLELWICFWHLSWIFQIEKLLWTWLLVSSMPLAQYHPWAMSWVKLLQTSIEA